MASESLQPGDVLIEDISVVATPRGSNFADIGVVVSKVGGAILDELKKIGSTTTTTDPNPPDDDNTDPSGTLAAKTATSKSFKSALTNLEDPLPDTTVGSVRIVLARDTNGKLSSHYELGQFATHIDDGKIQAVDNPTEYIKGYGFTLSRPNPDNPSKSTKYNLALRAFIHTP